MKRSLLFAFAALAALFAHAQDTVYVYEYLNRLPDGVPKSSASYYYLTSNAALPYQGLMKFYDLKGNLHAEIPYNAAGKMNGLATYYFKEGGKEKELLYKEGEINGPYKIWYRNGQFNEEGFAVALPKPAYGTDFTIHQYWDSLGTLILKDGNGELARLDRFSGILNIFIKKLLELLQASFRL